MPEKLDFKKKYKDLYQPKTVPMIIDVPKMIFIMIDGKGDPNDETGEFTDATELLYGLSYAIKMSSKSGSEPLDFFDYVVPPLEGLWWTENDRAFDTRRKDLLVWTLMIRQPEFVTEEVFKWAVNVLKKKKPGIDPTKPRLAEFTEGLCVQMMHVGPYDTEDVTVKAIDDFARNKGYINAISTSSNEGIILRHHEIYLSDPRKISPDKMRTVVRHPIKK